MFRLAVTSGKKQPGPVASASMLAILLAVAAWVLWPKAFEAGALLAAQDDPAALSDLSLRKAGFDSMAAEREIEMALAAGDADLAPPPRVLETIGRLGTSGLSVRGTTDRAPSSDSRNVFRLKALSGVSGLSAVSSPNRQNAGSNTGERMN